MTLTSKPLEQATRMAITAFFADAMAQRGFKLNHVYDLGAMWLFGDTEFKVTLGLCGDKYTGVITVDITTPIHEVPTLLISDIKQIPAIMRTIDDELKLLPPNKENNREWEAVEAAGYRHLLTLTNSALYVVEYDEVIPGQKHAYCILVSPKEGEPNVLQFQPCDTKGVSLSGRKQYEAGTVEDMKTVLQWIDTDNRADLVEYARIANINIPG